MVYSDWPDVIALPEATLAAGENPIEFTSDPLEQPPDLGIPNITEWRFIDQDETPYQQPKSGRSQPW